MNRYDEQFKFTAVIVTRTVYKAAKNSALWKALNEAESEHTLFSVEQMLVDLASAFEKAWEELTDYDRESVKDYIGDYDVEYIPAVINQAIEDRGYFWIPSGGIKSITQRLIKKSKASTS